MTEREPTEREPTEERILNCLDGLEFLADLQPVEDGWDTIAQRIHDLTFARFGWHEFRVYTELMDKNEHTPMLYQQLLYHMIPLLTQDERIMTELIKTLFGENDEYLIEAECLFTEKLYREVYEICVKEHMESYRAWFFETEDLEGEELERHLEFVEYAKQNIHL
jgi:hypothetical protein